MLTYESKTFPNATPLTIYETKIDDEQMNKDLIKVIDERGDEQQFKTNVKAQMTNYDMTKSEPFIKLTNYMRELVENICIGEEKTKVKLIFPDIWGAKYESGQFAISHQHFPASFSLVYYIHVPHQCPAGLIFTDANIMKKVYSGLLLCFNGNVKHHVPQTEFRGSRYVAASNAYIQSYDR